MTAYLLPPLIQTLFCLVLFAIVLKGHSRSFIHRLFSLFLLGLSIWAIIIFGMRASPDVEHAYSWEKWLVAVGPFTSVLFYHFAIRYTATKVKSGLIHSLYIICFLFIPLGATDLVFSGMQIKPFGYAPVFGPIMPFHVLFNYGVFIMALLTFVRAYRTSSYAEQRNRAAYIITAMVFSLAGAAFDILTALGLPLYPGMVIGNITFCLLTTIAILKFNLLDIRIVMRKSIAYILISALIAIPFIGIFLLATNVFVEESFPLWTYFVLLLILALVLPQLWQKVQGRVNKWFYRDRYDYLKALETFSWETQSLTDSATLGSTMANLIVGALRASNVCLLQPLPQSGDFATVCSAGVSNHTSGILLKNRSPLLRWLERFNGMLSYQDLDIIPQLQNVIYKEKADLQQLGAELIVPLKARPSQLSGVLILGHKVSDQPYTVEDKQLIYTISNQMAINLENVRLYNDALQARENLETWLNTMSDCVMIVNTDCVLQFANKAVAEKMGSKLSQICREILAQVTRSSHRTVASYLSGEIKAYQYVDNIGDRQYDVAAAPLSNPDGRTSIILVLRDVTERKQAEDRERRLSRLASIGELAAGVAHEINNPLTGILGFSERLLGKSTEENVSRELEIIHNEALRAAKVVQNLLTFARRHESKKQYVDLNDILQQTLELRSYELKTSGIEVVTDLAPNLPETMADFHQIQQVFLNIIMNAEQAMNEANCTGKLSIKTQHMKDYIRISFTDSGPGILPEHLDKLFSPFFTTRGESGGTGLGLCACDGIMTEHDGRIYAKSKPGKGTTFFVELPVTTGEKRHW